MSHIYDTIFYDYIESGSRTSAAEFAKILRDPLKVESLLDVGCGRGAWLSEWQKAGVPYLFGVDGDYVNLEDFHVDPKQSFKATDLTLPFNLGRRFDIVQSLEVAEHLPEEASGAFVKSITQHADIVIFSAAQPGQGGENHINEQSLEYWRKLFAEFGFEPYDCIRDKVAGNTLVMPWYRYNTILYANGKGAARLPDQFRASHIKANQKLAPGGTLKWRLRRAIVNLLPRPAVDKIAILNARRIAKSLAKSHDSQTSV